MGTTLVSKIKNILELPEELDEDKEGLIKKEIEHYRKDYPLLEEAIQDPEGKIFTKTYQPLYEKYGWVRTIFPKWLRKQEAEVVKGNEELVYCHGLENNKRLIRSYLWGTPLLSAAVLLEISTIFPELVNAVPPAGTYDLVSGVVMGIVYASIGIVPRITMRRSKSYLEKDLKVLDEQIEKIYSKK